MLSGGPEPCMLFCIGGIGLLGICGDGPGGPDDLGGPGGPKGGVECAVGLAPGGGGGGGPGIGVLTKELTGWWFSIITSALLDLCHSSRSKPSRMRMSTASALVGWAMIRKKAMVLEKSSLSVCSSTCR